MSEEPRPFSTYADMMSKVGRFMFYWSLLEQQLKNSIEDARARLQLKPVKVTGTLLKRLDVWEELAAQLPENVDKAAIASEVRLQTLALKHIRNQIVHGLCGGSSDPEDGEAHILCIEGGHENPTGKTIAYTLSQLEDFTQGIDACRRAFMSLRNFNYQITPP